jgi:hypothetical protein
MDTRTILADLKAELNRINQAIAALESLGGTATAITSATKSAPMRGGRRRISAAGRKRISEAAKARWAARSKTARKSTTDQSRVKARRGGGRKKRRNGA